MSREDTARVIGEVADERRRQVDVERYTDAADDRYTNGELAEAAAAYTVGARLWMLGIRPTLYQVTRWPWSREWWRPKNARRDLIRAAALIVAEIERLDRTDA